jgi:hypothetical protein
LYGNNPIGPNEVTPLRISRMLGFCEEKLIDLVDLYLPGELDLRDKGD